MTPSAVSRQKQNTRSRRIFHSITHVKKREGYAVPFKQERITNAILRALHETHEGEQREAEKLSDRAVLALAEKFDGEIPSVEGIQDIVVASLRKEGFLKTAEAYAAYREKRSKIRKEKYFLINKGIKVALTPNAVRVLESRYLRKDDRGKVIETPQQLFERVATNIAQAERIYKPDISDEELFSYEETFYRMMASLEFMPNSPALMNAGAPLQQLAACFVLPVPDSIDGIFTSLMHQAKIHQSGGGTGFGFSRLRPKGDMVKSTHGVASGPISFMQIFDKATDIIKQGGKRRGANMGILRIDHPDILEFIDMKRKPGVMENFNVSVTITDAFMDAYAKGEKYWLVNPRNNEKAGQLDARMVFDKIVRAAWETADPGLIFLDRINDARGNATPKLGQIEATNPCGEVPLLPYESCILGSIVLSRHTKEEGGRMAVDWPKLKTTVHNAMRFLDNLIDMSRYPVAEIEAMTHGNRRTGLGVMGFADLLIQLEIPFGFEESYKIAERIMEFIDKEAVKASVELARQRGAFPNFRDSLYDKPGRPRVRNVARTSIAPTGTIGIIAGCSQGIEPIFALAYIRYSHIAKEADEWAELVEVNPVFEEMAKRDGFYSKELMEKIAHEGTVQGIKEVPVKWRRVFVTAHDLNAQDHIKIQAAFQKHTDNAVSKTINMPATATADDVKKAYLLAWETGCKGITIYRDQSKAQQVLNIKGHIKKEPKPEGEIVNVRKLRPDLRDSGPEIPPNGN
ncbi:MAG: ribonucleoside-diphosphate reductase, adenosylcobalamin-dependent [Candidatus Terrybacteria bacterium RIFCSPLOWO2_01_FULL_48_14]|nr:MAG: ribonucleoside-diphosphate reductase, adenosylcobalamin-dependent [Candidatus Terrybacteria bacterium RIFCSPLOWO2_01_FULL_48_14]